MNYDPDLEPILTELRESVTQLREEDERLKSRLDRVETMQVELVKRLDQTDSVPPPTSPSVWLPEFPGDTPVGTIRWGCSYMGGEPPIPHETDARVAVGLRRTFWRLDQSAKIISTCKVDHAAGRLPWISIKIPVTWQAASTGSIDAPLKRLIDALGALGKPVWFTVHHEPEGGNGTPFPDNGEGTEIHWRNMQSRVRSLIDAAKVTNIAFAPILMAWTFDSRSGRNPNDWWVDGIWDFAGIDHYVDISATSMLTPMWVKAKAFYDAQGLKIAVGEWGNKDHGISGTVEMQEWYDHLRNNNVVGAAYFDTNLNGGVPLSGEVLTKFRSLMKASTSVRLA